MQFKRRILRALLAGCVAAATAGATLGSLEVSDGVHAAAVLVISLVVGLYVVRQMMLWRDEELGEANGGA